MASLHKMPARMQVFTTPAELRKLADKMQAHYDNAKLGTSLIVEVWEGEGCEIVWTADQEKCVHNQYCLRCEKNTDDNKAQRCSICDSYRSK